MRIGKLAKSLNISTDTIRFYEKRGLIGSQRRANGYRDYASDEVARLKLIRLAQGLGFTLTEIAGVVQGLQGEGLDEAEVASILAAKISEIERKAADLLALRDMLAARLAQACPLQVPPVAPRRARTA